jgi:hypothetical protein
MFACIATSRSEPRCQYLPPANECACPFRKAVVRSVAMRNLPLGVVVGLTWACLTAAACEDSNSSTSVDSGSVDSGSVDSGSVDSGSVDSGSVDSGSVDSGSVDSGSTDSGLMDSGMDGSDGSDGSIPLVPRTVALLSAYDGTGAFGSAYKLGAWQAPVQIGTDAYSQGGGGIVATSAGKGYVFYRPAASSSLLTTTWNDRATVLFRQDSLISELSHLKV